MPDSLRLGILSVAGLLATFAFNAALIYVLGVGDDVDSYVAAFTIPQFLNVIFASGCFSVLVPHYANKDKAYQTCHASQLLRIAFPLSVIFSAFLCVFSGSWVAFAFENVFAKQPDLLLQLSMFFLLILPAWAVFLVATSVLYAQNKFVLVGAITAFPMIFIAAALPIALYFFGIVSAVALQVIAAYIQSLLAWRAIDYQSHQRGKQKFLGNLVRDFFYVTSGNAYLKSDLIFDRYLVASGNSGDVTLFFLAKQVADALSGLIGKVFVNTQLPIFSRVYMDDGAFALANTYRATAKKISKPLVLIFFCCLFIFSAGQFFQGDWGATLSWLGQFLVIFLLMFGVVAFGVLGALAANTFYSKNETRIPVIISVASLTVAFVFKYFMFNHFGVLGLALAISIYYLVNFIAMHWMLISNGG
ncbi:MAG: hypothetical protein E6R09_13200 [Rhodocyclaceae bacterium]|nr:MAG: hypothetical protein E6R09_13200 [Rhodocyclaceae bacterium]